MGRVSRIVVPDVAHHITQRGNRGADVFEDDEDRRTYMAFLSRYTAKHDVSLWAYCLMTNHIHLIAVPKHEFSLARALRDTHTVYSMRFNRRREVTGHLWQGRFYSCPLDDDHMWAAVRYVERNPVRAGLVSRAEDFEWSSAAAHCGLRRDKILADEFPPHGVITNWSDWLRDEEDDAKVESIRRNTGTGRPCGSASFIDQLETLIGRILRPQKRGRKPRMP
jgi:putative transposase